MVTGDGGPVDARGGVNGSPGGAGHVGVLGGEERVCLGCGAVEPRVAGDGERCEKRPGAGADGAPHVVKDVAVHADVGHRADGAVEDALHEVDVVVGEQGGCPASGEDGGVGLRGAVDVVVGDIGVDNVGGAEGGLDAHEAVVVDAGRAADLAALEDVVEPVGCAVGDVCVGEGHGVEDGGGDAAVSVAEVDAFDGQEYGGGVGGGEDGDTAGCGLDGRDVLAEHPEGVSVALACSDGEVGGGREDDGAGDPDAASDLHGEAGGCGGVHGGL